MYKDKDKQKQAQREAAKRYRARKGMTEVGKPPGMTVEGMTQGVTALDASCPVPDIKGTFQHYQANPEMYATRAHPERLNWGLYMTHDQLEQAGLKANRVTIPGDWDYAGVCVQKQGDWDV